MLGWTTVASGLFALAGWIGSSLPRGLPPRPGAEVPIMVESNGIHTEIVLPVRTRMKDWRETFPSAGGKGITHIAIAWGDREVFLRNPTWGDLEPATVARIAVQGGPGILRVSHLSQPSATDFRRRILLTQGQYGRLVRRIEKQVRPGGRVHAGHLPHQRFYEARGRYTLANTCNQWTSDHLAAAGIRTGRWTPFAGGVMKWVPPAGDDIRQPPA